MTHAEPPAEGSLESATPVEPLSLMTFGALPVFAGVLLLLGTDGTAGRVAGVLLAGAGLLGVLVGAVAAGVEIGVRRSRL